MKMRLRLRVRRDMTTRAQFRRALRSMAGQVAAQAWGRALVMFADKAPEPGQSFRTLEALGLIVRKDES